MDSQITLQGKRYFSSKRCGQLYGYTNDHIARLCRSGDLECKSFGRQWYVEQNSIARYKRNTLERQVQRNQEISRKIKTNLVKRRNRQQAGFFFKIIQVGQKIFSTFLLWLVFVFSPMGVLTASAANDPVSPFSFTASTVQFLSSTSAEVFVRLGDVLNKTQIKDTLSKASELTASAWQATVLNLEEDTSWAFQLTQTLAQRTQVVTASLNQGFFHLVAPLADRSLIQVESPLFGGGKDLLSEAKLFFKKAYTEGSENLAKSFHRNGQPLVVGTQDLVASVNGVFKEGVEVISEETADTVNSTFDLKGSLKDKVEPLFLKVSGIPNLISQKTESVFIGFGRETGKSLVSIQKSLSSVRTKEFSKNFRGSISAAVGEVDDSAISLFGRIQERIANVTNSVIKTLTHKIEETIVPSLLSPQKNPDTESQNSSGNEKPSGVAETPSGPVPITPILGTSPKVIERVNTIERIIEKQPFIISGGVTSEEIETRFQQISNKLQSDLTRFTSLQGASNQAIYQTISYATKIDKLPDGATITTPSISGGTISNATLSGTFSGTVSSLTVSSAATSTFSAGIDISGGCFAVNGVCLGGSSGSGTVDSGTTGYLAYYGSSGTSVSATSTIFLSTSSYVGIGTTSPWRTFSVQGSSDLGFNALAGSFTATSTTASILPYASTTALTISGTAYIGSLTGPLQAINGTVSASSTLSAVYGGTGVNSFGGTNTLLYTSSANTLTSSSNLIFDGTKLGIGTSTPWGRLSVHAAAGETSFAIGSSTATYFAVDSIGRVGIGTTSPVTTLSIAGNTYLTGGLGVGIVNTSANTVNIVSGGSYQIAEVSVLNGTTLGSGVTVSSLTSVGTLTSLTVSGGQTSLAGANGTGGTAAAPALIFTDTNTGIFNVQNDIFGFSTGGTERARFDDNGRFGIGTTSPFRTLSVTNTSAQVAVSYDTTRYADVQVDSSGDLILNPSGDDVFLNDDNLFVCSGGACPSGTISGTGNIIAETRIGIGTSTPTVQLDIVATTPTIRIRDSSVTSGFSISQSSDASTTINNVANGALLFGTNNTERLRVTAAGLVGIGTTSPSQQLSISNLLFVGAGGATGLGTATSTFQGDIRITGKLDVGTIDPVYTIDGTKYATYGHSTIGVKEETVTTIAVESYNKKTKRYEYKISFDSLEKGSDLWLFYQVTDFGTDWKDLVVNLTAGFEGNVSYKKLPDEKSLLIVSQNPGEVSARFIASRFDTTKWPNLRTDQDDKEYQGFILDSKK